MTLASLDFLARVEAAGSARLGGLDRLAIDDHSRRGSFASLGFTRLHHQDAQNLRPQAAVAPGIKLVLHRRERREILRQIPPGTTGTNQIKQRVQNDKGIGPLAAPPLRRGQERQNHREFLSRQVACITLANDGIFLSVGLAPRHHCLPLSCCKTQRIRAHGADQPSSSADADTAIPEYPHFRSGSKLGGSSKH